MPTTSANSLFGHFAAASGSPEKHATRALTYLLQTSPTARAALKQLVQQIGVELPPAVFYDSEVLSSEGCIPDVVGFDSFEGKRVIVEGKFWAGLTPHQPVSYLHSLSEDAPGLVLFVAPGIRLSHLWRELQVACMDSSTPYSQPQIPPIGEASTMVGSNSADDSLDVDNYHMSYARVGPHTLAVTSWRHLLSTLQQALQATGEERSVADVQQLQGLCDVMDADAFLPLSAEELDPARGRRLQQFGDLIDKVLDRVEEEPWLSSRGRYSSDPSSFGCNFRMHTYDAWVGVSSLMWGAMRAAPSAATPLWVEFYGRRDQIRALQQKLTRLLERADDDRFQTFYAGEGGPSLAVALHLPLGVDEERVIERVATQLREIATALGDAEGAAAILSNSKSQQMV